MNKPLDVAEVKVYGKKTRIILGLDCSALIFLMVFDVKNTVACISIALFVQSVMLVLGKMKNGRIKE